MDSVTEKQMLKTGRRTIKNKRAINIVKRILVFLLSMMIIGIAYQKIGTYFDDNKYKPVGKIIEVSGHRMHIYKKGQGNITVVFASGWGTATPYTDFYPLYNKISKHAKIAVYDRPGYGWSELSTTPRDIDTITKELHELLIKSGTKPPYILVGHSLGSFEVLRFSQLYKNEVKGIVMIDGRSPEFNEDAKVAFSDTTQEIFKKIALQTGVVRLLFSATDSFKTAALSNGGQLIPKELNDIYKAQTLKLAYNKNVEDETKNLIANANTVCANGKLGNIPLRIFTSSDSNKIKSWADSQEKFIEWSSDSKQVVVSDSKHYIHHDKPEIINKGILELIK